MLVEEVQAALQQQQQQQQQQQAASALSTTSAAGNRASAALSEAGHSSDDSAAEPGIQLLKTIGQDPAAEVPGAFGGDAANGSLPLIPEFPARMQAAVLTASPEALQLVKASPLVKGVIQDQVIIAQPVTCVEQQYVGTGVSTIPRSTFSWPACYTSRAKLMWRGITCGDGSTTFCKLPFQVLLFSL
jgi:hypothetical protein